MVPHTVSLSPQARQILEREYNNLLALGTERRLDEVRGGAGLSLPAASPTCRLRSTDIHNAGH